MMGVPLLIQLLVVAGLAYASGLFLGVGLTRGELGTFRFLQGTTPSLRPQPAPERAAPERVRRKRAPDHTPYTHKSRSSRSAGHNGLRRTISRFERYAMPIFVRAMVLAAIVLVGVGATAIVLYMSSVQPGA